MSCCRAFVVSRRLSRLDLYPPQPVAYVRASNIATLNFAKNTKFRIGHPPLSSFSRCLFRLDQRPSESRRRHNTRSLHSTDHRFAMIGSGRDDRVVEIG